MNTLVILAGTRAASVADQLDAIQWSMEGDFTGIVIGPEVFPVPDGFRSFASTDRRDPGFAALRTLREVCRAGGGFDQVCYLTEDSLPIGQGLDSWAYAQQSTQAWGLLGVEDYHGYWDSYASHLHVFAEMRLPYGDWDLTPKTVCSQAWFLSWAAVGSLFAANALDHEATRSWRLPIGPYLSWATQILGHYQVCFGQADRPEPPLFVSSRRHHWLPSPHILHPGFLLYHSVRRVLGYSEEQIRNGYRQLRNNHG